MRCYNCGEFANHIASECALGPQPKRCHRCRGEDHLHADCPHRNVVSTEFGNDSSSYPRTKPHPFADPKPQQQRQQQQQ